MATDMTITQDDDVIPVSFFEKLGWQLLNFEEVQGAFSRTATSCYGIFVQLSKASWKADCLAKCKIMALDGVPTKQRQHNLSTGFQVLRSISTVTQSRDTR